MVDKPPCLMSDRRGRPGAHSERQPSQIIGIHWPLSRPHLSSCLQGPRAPRPLQGSPPPPTASGGSTTPKPEGGTGSWLHPSWDLAPSRGSSTPAPGLSLSWFLSQRHTPAEHVVSKISAGQNKAMRLTVSSQA